MDTNLVERLTNVIFSKALQVRRMIQRGWPAALVLAARKEQIR